MTKFKSLIDDFGNALKRFEDVLREEKTDIVRDSAIKRFEIVFDLAWKTIKAFMEEHHNITCVSPRSCLREAFRLGLIDHNDHWLRIADDRNYTVHTYREALAERIYRDLPAALPLFQKLAAALHKTNGQ